MSNTNEQRTSDTENLIVGGWRLETPKNRVPLQPERRLSCIVGGRHAGLSRLAAVGSLTPVSNYRQRISLLP